jgi:hypothetical protein
VTILVVVFAWSISQQRAPTTEITAERLYPELLDKLNDIASVSIEAARDITALARMDDGWVIANRDNFPANFSAVKLTLLNLAEAMVIDKKTSKPENYAKLGVSGVEDEDSDSVFVRVQDRDGAELASLIIGNERSGTTLGSPNYYVRKSDVATALLAEGELNVSADPQQWMDTDLVNVATDRVRKVTINRNRETPIVVSKDKRSDNFFALQGIPTGFTSKSRAVASSLGALLLDVKFQDVAAGQRIEGLIPRAIAEVETFDGLVATLEQFDFQEHVYIRLRFEFNPDIVVPDEQIEAEGEEVAGGTPLEPPSVRDEVADLNAKVADWVYVLPDYKIRMLDKQFDDMIKPAETAADKKDEAKPE